MRDIYNDRRLKVAAIVVLSVSKLSHLGGKDDGHTRYCACIHKVNVCFYTTL